MRKRKHTPEIVSEKSRVYHSFKNDVITTTGRLGNMGVIVGTVDDYCGLLGFFFWK